MKHIYPDYVRCNADKADLKPFDMAGREAPGTRVTVWAHTEDEADEVFRKWEQSERKPEPDPTPDLFES
jgi:hypothetical protein